jgi:hypothetical protein
VDCASRRVVRTHRRWRANLPIKDVAMPVVLSYNPAGPKFAISADAVMPAITVTATLSGVRVDPKTPPIYGFTASLTFSGNVTPHGNGRSTQHRAITAQTGPRNTFAIPFTEVRGGALLVNVSVRIGAAAPIIVASQNLTIVGTNPTPAAIKSYANSIGATKVRFRKQMRQESSLEQFRSTGWPKYSSDNLGGVGLCQITRPAPTADQVWNWKDNVDAGWALYGVKEAAARAYPIAVRAGSTFRGLVQAWNAQPARRGLPPVAVTLPDDTDEQLELDTIRGFNGFAGGLHEFRVRLDNRGLLVVTLDASGHNGAAEWERVPVNERGTSGDPNYVNNVEAQADF